MGSAWHVLGASVSGTSHQRMGRGCDDAHAYRIGDGYMLLAAADGAGSAERSALGAATVVQKALDAAEEMLLQQGEPAEREQWLDALPSILQEVHEALVSLSQESVSPSASSVPTTQPEQAPASISLHDLATTLLLAIVTENWLAVAQIGDGAVAIQRVDGTIASLTPRTQQEQLDTTDFVTDDTYLQSSMYVVQPRADLQGIALLTDGLQMAAMHFPDNTAHEPFFVPLFKFVLRPDASEAELQRFLTSERICARSDDDKTLVLAVCQ